MDKSATKSSTPADECGIKVVCRIRPLNSSEEKAGSKFVVKFPTEDSINCGVGIRMSRESVIPRLRV